MYRGTRCCSSRQVRSDRGDRGSKIQQEEIRRTLKCTTKALAVSGDEVGRRRCRPSSQVRGVDGWGKGVGTIV